jgi:hypothetical protein
MFYLHPWEIDPDQPRLPGSLGTRFRHYLNLASTERKLEWLLAHFRFGTLSEALAGYTTEAMPDAGMFTLNQRICTPV